ncbi:MAG: hypothetical protein A2406_02950 [Candidatus Komeilibacteria bacterium RIFOXYC1_FULL_37_11]|uniref:Lipoprotein n=1 Tax=Candidatus Komeilibacteria bacterium RIFOXYC1_FULL_37_11 TaxID=1798555 RepID=A0A1G2BYY5_9BACT|nr:MAG: hypothetical protein A2406_02950 [Candidatus Komeilibacteria bacterium RIFOXYC1_FULL_37_11]OGY95693.1 MAG: hypothetical protein A2611_02835 [Candidatus Komeilibacteria bacterium RIFOXYD1_FULL_37_29]
MKLKQSRIVIFSLFISLVNLLAVGCFFAGQSLMDTHDHTPMVSECCSISSSDSSEHVGYGLEYNLTDIDYLLLNVGLLVALMLVVYVKEINFLNYYTIKDRYGGFKLFYKFILLFKKGILNPKIY